MPPSVPLDEGHQGNRVGPFWIEEGMGLVAFGAILLLLVGALYLAAMVARPT